MKGLSTDYLRKTRKSSALYDRSKGVFAGGVNHNARYYAPYPLFVRKAAGQYLWDEDGNRYVDYWMGHMALILGHSPGVVVEALKEQIQNGTHFGMGSRLSVELGEEVRRSVPCAEMMRFCNTGAEATMYLVRLARAFTRRRIVIKMGGGWHGYNTELNKGVHLPFSKPEGAGILPEEQAHVKSVRFNDLQETTRVVMRDKNDVALIFLEPVLGAGGCIPATSEFMKGLRELADKSGAVLAFDEIITGFRLGLGGAQESYRVVPDIATFGKVVGGGLPIGLVCGQKEIILRSDPSRREGFVSIGGGTFSENPLSMAAGLATLRYLRKNKMSVYPRLKEEGRRLRAGLDAAFREVGITASTTGAGSLFLTHFGETPHDAQEAAADNKAMTHDYALFMMSRGVFLLPGHPGAISTAHRLEDLNRTVDETRRYVEDGKRKHGQRGKRRSPLDLRQS